jgi:TPR repeat protein
VPPALGGSSVVPRTNSRVVGETPSPADAWWKLGRMYAERGDDARAFGIFLQLVDSYRDNPGSVPPAVAANSHVQLGLYYLKGIPGTLPADRDVAHRLLEYAASFFGDAEAQYELGRLLLAGPRKNVVQAARWLQAAAKKNHRPAQALLGSVLLRGEGIARQPGLGLFFLMLANDGEDPPEPWIKDLYASALAQATEKDRVAAYRHLEEWLKDPRQ